MSMKVRLRGQTVRYLSDNPEPREAATRAGVYVERAERIPQGRGFYVELELDDAEAAQLRGVLDRALADRLKPAPTNYTRRAVEADVERLASQLGTRR